jgi:hypothetical protein
MAATGTCVLEKLLRVHFSNVVYSLFIVTSIENMLLDIILLLDIYLLKDYISQAEVLYNLMTTNDYVCV